MKMPQNSFLDVLLGFLFPLVFILMSSCQVYRSVGRKQFEGKAPTYITSINGSSLEKASPQENWNNKDNISDNKRVTHQSKDDNETVCWTQESHEPLWSIQQGEVLKVQLLENQQIEVCRESKE